MSAVSYTYQGQTPSARKALVDVSLTVGDGEFVAIVGHTGCGKSTLAQMLNALLTPKAGTVTVDGLDSRNQGKAIRRLVGLVFQYPEQQLFEETVAADVAFGPKNLGLSPSEVRRRVDEALRLVGMGESADKSPFALSGGQMRRVAIAGVLAMRPKYLVLDEPTAGLDGQAHRDLAARLLTLQRGGTALVLITHDMSLASRAKRLLVMAEGAVIGSGRPEQMFADPALLARAGLTPPPSWRLLAALRARGWNLAPTVADADTVARLIRRSQIRP